MLERAIRTPEALCAAQFALPRPLPADQACHSRVLRTPPRRASWYRRACCTCANPDWKGGRILVSSLWGIRLPSPNQVGSAETDHVTWQAASRPARRCCRSAAASSWACACILSFGRPASAFCSSCRAVLTSLLAVAALCLAAPRAWNYFMKIKGLQKFLKYFWNHRFDLLQSTQEESEGVHIVLPGH